MINSQILSRLWSQPEFQRVVNELMKPNIPEIPAYFEGKTEKAWVYGSGMRDGYLLALKHLGVEID